MSPFERNKVIKTVQDVAHLAERLSRCAEVVRYNVDNHKEEWALAGSFADLEESFRTFLDDHLPKLVTGDLNDQELLDLLVEIGVDFQHMIYHILAQPKFYRYLEDEKTGSK